MDTIGFNDKSWLDFYGDPHSDEMHLTERYKRVDHDTLTMQLIVDDPKAYTKTWVGDTKIFKLLPKKDAEMEELFCIPERRTPLPIESGCLRPASSRRPRSDRPLSIRTHRGPQHLRSRLSSAKTS